MTTLDIIKKPSLWTTAYTIVSKSMIVIIASFLLFTAMLISTQTGLQIITSYISSSIPMQFENVQGRLLTGFQIDKVTLPNSITVEKVQGKWIKGSLIELQLHAAKLNIDTQQAQQILNVDIPTNILEKIPQTLIEKIEISLQLTPYQNPLLQARWSQDQTKYQLNSQLNDHEVSGNLLSHQSEDQHANITFHCADYTNNPLIGIHGQLWVDNNLLSIKIDKNQETEGERGSIHIQHKESQFHLHWHTHEQNHIVKARLDTDKHQAKLNMLHGKNVEYNLDFLSKEIQLGPLSLRDMDVTYQSSNKNNSLQKKVHFVCKKAQYEKLTTQNLKIQYDSNKDAQQPNKNDSQITAEVLRYQDTTIGRNLHLTSKGLNQEQDIHVTLDQKQGPLEANINIEKLYKEWKVLINKLVLAKNYLLISPDNPKKILFEPDHLIITSKHTANKPIPLDINLKYFYNHEIDAQITATSFPLNRLPKELLEVFIVPFDSLEGSINGNVQIKTQHQQEVSKLDGNLAIYIEQAKIRSILPEIPINSALNIKKAKLEGILSNQGVQIKGRGRVNQGSCDVDISAPWSKSKESSISLLVNGKNILFKQSSDSHIQLDSQLHILHQSGRTHTEGDINIHDSIYRSNTWDMSTQLPPETIVVSKNTPEA